MSDRKLVQMDQMHVKSVQCHTPNAGCAKSGITESEMPSCSAALPMLGHVTLAPQLCNLEDVRHEYSKPVNL